MNFMIKHLALIMDGNRRWAKKRSLQPWKGHEEGRDTLEIILNFCREKNIPEITLYTFSLQNFKRSKQEVEFLLKLLKHTFQSDKYVSQLHDHQVQVHFLGRLHLFDKDLQEILQTLEKETQDYDKYRLNICLAYGGREELVDAVRALVEANEDVSEEAIAKHLYLSSEPDLIIRTGGEHRTSNFLPWQSTYSEWFFIPEKWPEVTPEILDTIFKEFEARERRYGT